MNETKSPLIVTVPVIIDQIHLYDIIIAAIECNCPYWCSSIKILDNERKEISLKELADNYSNIIGNCRIIFTERVDTYYRVKTNKNNQATSHVLDLTTLAQLQKGIILMADTQPLEFANLINYEGGCDTGDVLIQLILFGKIQHK